jgi:hypothetical protein
MIVVAKHTHDLQQYNQSILKAESNWLNPDGIPGRPWFKHLLYCARSPV